VEAGDRRAWSKRDSSTVTTASSSSRCGTTIGSWYSRNSDSPGTPRVWSEPFVTLYVPKLFNLRTDPFERVDIKSNTYYDWFVDHVLLLVPAQAYVGEFLATFREYPQRQKAASFNLDDVLRRPQEGTHK
jgi:hypothetical protein